MFYIVQHLTIFSQSREAARKELLDKAESPDECEKLYEESLWCLYALRDDLLEDGKAFMNEDRKTISMCTYRHSLLGFPD